MIRNCNIPNYYTLVIKQNVYAVLLLMVVLILLLLSVSLCLSFGMLVRTQVRIVDMKSRKYFMRIRDVL